MKRLSAFVAGAFLVAAVLLTAGAEARGEIKEICQNNGADVGYIVCIANGCITLGNDCTDCWADIQALVDNARP